MSKNLSESRCRGLNCNSSSFINAHIVPAGFGRIIRGDGPNVSLSLEETREARPQLGEYDREILCQDCDNKLGIFDDYAIEVCRNFQSKHKLLTSDMFEMLPFDGEKFAKFILAVLWRASISKRPNYNQVLLGPYEDKARDVLFGAGSLDSLKAFEVIIQRYKSKHLDMQGIYTLPVRASFLNLNTYGFGLVGFRILAKLDARPLRREFAPFVINNANTLRGFFIEYEKTQEFSRLKDIAVTELRRDRRCA
jgi:hypothetical protein